jgi:hypothetical protein
VSSQGGQQLEEERRLAGKGEAEGRKRRLGAVFSSIGLHEGSVAQARLEKLVKTLHRVKKLKQKILWIAK